ncbi:MAG: 2OG-Fe(II) oxygenase [Acinetobacter sp.]
MFNCYQHDGHFGQHVDNAIRKNPSNNQPMRTDLSCTVFFTNPDEYEGGELLIEDTSFGSKSVKLPAGHAILYPLNQFASGFTRSAGHVLLPFF